MNIFTTDTGKTFVDIKLGEVQANPFRRIGEYPILPSKVATLKNSMTDTGFWTNVIGRLNDGDLQIAYGHHRLAAALEAFGPDHVHTFPVEDYDDERMLRIMAEENSDEWANAVEHGMMVTMAARDYLDAWFTDNAAEAFTQLTTYTGEFGGTTSAPDVVISSEVAVFIKLNPNLGRAVQAMEDAIKKGVGPNEIGVWLGKNYTRANRDNLRASSVISDGYRFIGPSAKHKAWLAAEREAQAEREAVAKAEREAADAAAKAAADARAKAEAEEQAKAEAERKAKADVAKAERKAKAEEDAVERKRLEADLAVKRKAVAKAKAEREAAEAEARAKARADADAKAKAEAKLAAEKLAAKKDKALNDEINRMIEEGFIDPEAIKLFPTVSLANKFREMMVGNQLGKHLPASEQVGVVSDFLKNHPEAKVDQLFSYLMHVIRNSQSELSVLFALEKELEEGLNKMVAKMHASHMGAFRFHELIKRIRDEGDPKKMAILARHAANSRHKIEETVTSLRKSADRLETLLPKKKRVA